MIPAARSLAVAFWDQTRMNDLARAEAAFIRPVPLRSSGGASQRAREFNAVMRSGGL
ncbi:hypothetical protein ACLK19_19485 [Escherichia coli]